MTFKLKKRKKERKKEVDKQIKREGAEERKEGVKRGAAWDGGESGHGDKRPADISTSAVISILLPAM